MLEMSGNPTYQDLAAKSDDKFRVADDPDTWKPAPERGGDGDHRMAFAASKALHRRFILRSTPNAAALEWFSN